MRSELGSQVGRRGWEEERERMESDKRLRGGYVFVQKGKEQEAGMRKKGGSRVSEGGTWTRLVKVNKKGRWIGKVESKGGKEEKTSQEGSENEG